MITFGVDRFLIYSAPMDMRKGIDTLAAVVLGELGRAPDSGEAFVFIGKRQDRLKVLVWKQHGYWLCQHRLERGRFRLPEVRRSDGRVCAVRLEARGSRPTPCAIPLPATCSSMRSRM